MIDKIFLKIKPAYIFNSFAVGLLIISIILGLIYKSTQKDIVQINHNANIEYVKSLSKNLNLDIKRIVKKDFYHSLDEDFIAREYVESNLKLFVTTKYKYIYLISKRDSDFIYLADGSANESKKNFNEKYISTKTSDFLEVYSSKKALYFKNEKVDDLWATYLSPIVVNDKVEAIIVIKFSLQEQETIISTLESLEKMFSIAFIFFVLIFIFILWFSYIDSKREEQKNIIFKKLQVSNIVLQSTTVELEIKSKKISELNDSLEDRVKEELAKNRAKDIQLIQQARLAQMGEMISMIAHQWRQPLASISATSSAIRIKSELGKLTQEIVFRQTDKISEYSHFLSETIDDFRNFFKPNRDKKETNYSDIIDSVNSIIGVSLNHKYIELVKELNSNESFISYPNELKQVILNLIKNAEDALIENKIKKPFIKLTTYNENGNYILKISDNAGGIPKDIIDKIFDPYFSTKSEKNGTGLGLYMSKMIIQEHCNGSLSVENSSEGAVFKIAIKDV